MAITNPYLYLADRSHDLFFIFDLTHDRFNYMNPACIAFFNLEGIDIASRILLRKIHSDDQHYILSKLKACTEGEAVADVECRVLRGKEEHWLCINPFLAKEDGHDLLIGQASDITALKANTATLNNRNDKKSSILNILAHDLAGPMGTISNLTELLTRDTAKFEAPSVDRYLRMINKICKSNIKLIRDFLNQEFLESAGVNLVKTRVELLKKITDTIADYFTLKEDLQVHFSCHSNKKKVFAEIDEDKFMQAINNLISNSLKFTPAGGYIDIYIRENKKNIVISIADSGIGIPQRYHATLFEKFSDARRRGLNGEHSTGLGMSIIKTIVEWHHGTIRFESEEDKGTIFYIQLPKA